MKHRPRTTIPEEFQGLLSLEPCLYVLSRPALDLGEIARFLSQEGVQWRQSSGTTAAEEIVEFAGRICYMSFGNKQSPKSNREYIQNLLDQQHDSVLEHATWTFLLSGVSRAFTHQLVRHRAGFSFSQMSQQYHDESAAKFVVPDEIKADPGAMETWLQTIRELRNVYQSLSRDLDRNKNGFASLKEARRSVRSAARSVLPNATETKVVFSANGRALRHFLSVRGAIPGDLEMRKVSALIYSKLQHEAPALISGFEMTSHSDGYPLVLKRC